jgi:hypothetical protein
MFKLNGIDILDPTIHRWLPRNMLGITGAGQPMYSGVREYELKWQLTSIGDYYQLLNAFSRISGTTTVVMALPQFYSTGTYTAFSYSGCILREPEYGQWFDGYYQDVTLLITNIRTG